jgi:PilZ domain
LLESPVLLQTILLETLRFSMNHRIYFWNPDLDGEGVISNVSKGGCRVSCETSVQMDMSFEAWIYTDGSDWPLKIERAEVCWIQGNEFGLHFISIWSSQRDRLHALLAHVRVRQTPTRLPSNAVVELSGGNTGQIMSGIPLINLSSSGCALHAGSTMLYPVNTRVSVRISCSDFYRPLIIQEAVVRWIVRKRFGLEYVTIAYEERDRLLRHIHAFKWANLPIEW